MREPLSNLKDSDSFEELCYDILEAEGFRNLKWRGPSADGGRDIETEWLVSDPSGGTFLTKWYVECKWYTDSVPFSEIEPKLLAATTGNVDFLLLITSSMVRNTALDSISEWLSRRQDPLKFRYWTGRDVLHKMVKHAYIFRKHFPNHNFPNWADQISQLQRLEAISRAGQDRQNWRVLPSIQWCRSTLRDDSNVAIISEVRNELELLAASLQLGLFIDSDLIGQPSLRVLSISDCLNQALRAAERKAGRKIKTKRIEPALNGLASYSLLLAGFFEVVLNCLYYSTDESTTILLSRIGLTWVVEVKNRSDETIPPNWPLVGVRGAFAKTRYSAGQGIGCWLTAESMKCQGLTIAWSTNKDYWIVSLKGGIEA